MKMTGQEVVFLSDVVLQALVHSLDLFGAGIDLRADAPVRRALLTICFVRGALALNYLETDTDVPALDPLEVLR